MMTMYARVLDGIVQELFSTDGDITKMFHPDWVWIDASGISPAPTAGWNAIESNGAWRFSEPVPPVPTDAELKLIAMSQRDALLSAANEATAGMADAYIADLLDVADAAKFKAYAAYKLALNKVDKQPGYPQTVTWPTLPQ